MAQPQAYNRTKDFTVDFQNETDHSALNAEFDAASNSINEIRANLSLIQADDGALRPQAVTYESLAPDLISQLVANIDEYAVHINDTAIQAAAAAQVSAENASQKADDASASADAAAEAAASFDINTHQTTILNWVKSLLFPVGATWITFGNENPATLFGGTWTKIAAGTCLVSAGTGFTNGSTYGANTKAITVANLPAHKHSGTTKAAGKHKHDAGTFALSGEVGPFITGRANISDITAKGALSYKSVSADGPRANADTQRVSVKLQADKTHGWSGYTSEQADHTHAFDTGNTGSGTAFNVMQSSIAVNIWRRTA